MGKKKKKKRINLAGNAFREIERETWQEIREREREREREKERERLKWGERMARGWDVFIYRSGIRYLPV